jgi:hypothetical protein
VEGASGCIAVSSRNLHRALTFGVVSGVRGRELGRIGECLRSVRGLLRIQPRITINLVIKLSDQSRTESFYSRNNKERDLLQND